MTRDLEPSKRKTPLPFRAGTPSELSTPKRSDKKGSRADRTRQPIVGDAPLRVGLPRLAAVLAATDRPSSSVAMLNRLVAALEAVAGDVDPVAEVPSGLTASEVARLVRLADWLDGVRGAA